jgi:hypothetical protein
MRISNQKSRYYQPKEEEEEEVKGAYLSNVTTKPIASGTENSFTKSSVPCGCSDSLVRAKRLEKAADSFSRLADSASNRCRKFDSSVLATHDNEHGTGY